MKKKEKKINYLALEYKQMELYFEEMALQGWKLTGFDAQRAIKTACFEEVKPHPIQYCVDFVQNDSPEYYETCKLSGWDYVDSNRYFHIFMHEGDQVETLQSDHDIESLLVKENIYQKELNRYYWGVVFFVFIMGPDIMGLFGFDTFLIDYPLNKIEDIFMILMLVSYVMYTVMMVEWTKRTVRKQGFLSRHKRPYSRFLGVYPFVLVSTIYIIYDFVKGFSRGEFIFCIVMIALYCVFGFKRKTD